MLAWVALSMRADARVKVLDVKAALFLATARLSINGRSIYVPSANIPHETSRVIWGNAANSVADL